MGEPALRLVEPESVSTQAFLDVMRGVAASVTIVTTDGPGGRYGTTVSSFTSVSVAPPTVLVCLAHHSRIAAAVRANGRFAVNVLSSAMQEIAQRFAGRDDAAVADRFDGVERQAVESGLPILAGATGLVCRLDDLTTVATHDVCFGQVEAVHGGGQAPLAYLDRSFCRVERL